MKSQNNFTCYRVFVLYRLLFFSVRTFLFNQKRIIFIITRCINLAHQFSTNAQNVKECYYGEKTIIIIINIFGYIISLAEARLVSYEGK